MVEAFHQTCIVLVKTSCSVPHLGLENTTVAEILKIKGDDDVGAVYWCHINDTVYDAVKQIVQNNIGVLVVVKPQDQKLVAGIITERGTEAFPFTCS